MISDTKKRVQISLTLDTLKELEAYAKSDGFTKSAIIELALEKLFSERASKKIDNKRLLCLAMMESSII
jgi:metal-responsive CopG/Arc/MetJ family transcriptional regulator